MAGQSVAPLPGTLIRWIGNGSAQQPELLYVVDKSGVAIRLFAGWRRVSGQSALVLNPTTGLVTWANGATERTPVATLTVTNPSANQPLVLTVQLYHGVYLRLGTAASPKAQTISGYSLLSFDDGGGTLTPFGAVANGLGSGQIAAQATQHDVGANLDAGNQNASTLLVTVPVAAGASVTLRVQSQLYVRDGNSNAVAWSYCQVRAEGYVQL